MKIKADYRAQFSGSVEVDQAEPVQEAAYGALQCNRNIEQMNAELAESERAAIDISGDWRGYVFLIPLTWSADSLFGYFMLAGLLTGALGELVTWSFALFIGTSAVAVESFAAHLYETRPHWAVRAVTFSVGLMVPAALLWVLLVLQHALAVNGGAAAAGAGTKLWTFGGIAVALHMFLFLAGGRVRRGVIQLNKSRQINSLVRSRERALETWRKCCEQAILLDHRLSYSVKQYNKRNPQNPIEAPDYDVLT